MSQLSKDIAELLNKKSTVDFLSAARHFVTLLESSPLNQEVFYRDSHRILAELYRTGLNLESVELVYSSSESVFKDIDKGELRGLNKNIISNLGKDCFYWEVFDPVYDKEKEPTQGWLVDDFADMYADLKTELIKIDQVGTDESVEDALWQLKFGFNNHWGNHCIDAMRAMHYLWYDGKVAM